MPAVHLDFRADTRILTDDAAVARERPDLVAVTLFELPMSFRIGAVDLFAGSSAETVWVGAAEGLRPEDRRVWAQLELPVLAAAQALGDAANAADGSVARVDFGEGVIGLEIERSGLDLVVRTRGIEARCAVDDLQIAVADLRRRFRETLDSMPGGSR